MNAKDASIVGLILVLVILLLIGRRRVSGYTQEQIDMIPQTLPIRGENRVNIQKYLIKVIRNQIEKTDPLANVNALVDSFNAVITDPAKKLTPYGTITDFDNLITNVYTSGETSSMSERDRIILRAIAWPNMTLLDLDTSLKDPYTAPDGKADFTDTIVSETGKTIEELFKFAYVLLDTLISGDVEPSRDGFSSESIDYINSYIPSKYDPPFLNSDGLAPIEALRGTTDRGKFLVKLLTISPIYIKWMIENKWKLDLTWRPSLCDQLVIDELSSNSVMFLPSKIIKGLGTYTSTELGNPTSFIPYGMLEFQFKNELGQSVAGFSGGWRTYKSCIRETLEQELPSGVIWSSVTINSWSETSS